MALKIPVVATMAGGIPDLIEDNRTGFTCPPNDPAALAETIVRCLKAHNKEQVVAEAAKKAQNFDVFRTVEGTETLYKEVLKLYPQTFPHN
jgi:glycosyltransferase involved in cell wall biosynthesis